MMNRTRKNYKRKSSKGGTRSILRKANNTNKTKKSVKWAPSVVSPKEKLGKTRSRTKAQSKRK